MRNEAIGNIGATTAIAAVLTGMPAAAIVGAKMEARGRQLDAGTQAVAVAKERIATVSPTLFGPDSPQALDDALRGAEEALPGLQAATRGPKVAMAAVAIGASALFATGLATVVYGFNQN